MERRTDEVQLLEALRSNRQKRERQGRFLVEGVRNIDAAVRAGWSLDMVLVPTDLERPRSRWATELLDRVEVEQLHLPVDLFDSLTDRDERPELVLVARMPARRTLDADVPVGRTVVVLDRIASPGNLGTIVRTADALGAGAVITVGHSASPWDPQCVRASTGSLFAVPVVAIAGPDELVAWARSRRLPLVATDEAADIDVAAAALVPPTAVLLGNETTGLSRALRDAADVIVRIPITGTASSLNVAVAAGIVLHELARRERA